MTGLPSIAAVLAVVATFAATLAPVAADPAAPPPTAAAAARATPAAVAGRPLPAIPRVPDGALLVGADQRYALYHANRFGPATGRLELLVVSLADGHVVRTVTGPDVQCCERVNVRYVDGSILMEQTDGSVVRTDALTGEVTGTVAAPIVVDPTVLALDDRWVLTPTAVRWFDGRVVPVLYGLPAVRFPRALGDSSLAVLTESDGSAPLVLTPSTGQVVALARQGETVRVIAARGGRSPEVYGRVAPDGSTDETDDEGDEAEDGLARWTDPAHAAGRTVVDSDVTPVGGGFAGSRLIASVREDFLGLESIVEVDRTTGRTSAALTDRVLAESTIGDWPRVRGQSVVQAGDGVLVSLYNDARGALSLVTGTGTRPLAAALRPTLHSACRLNREGNRIEVDLCSGISGYAHVHTYLGTRVITAGQSAWRETGGPLIVSVSPVPLGQRPYARCPGGGSAKVTESRGRWQLERCVAGARWYVTDVLGHLSPYLVRGVPRLGADHVVSRVATATPGRDVLEVTGLDARHRSRVFGPLGADYSVDRSGAASAVYVDPIGRVRVADVSGLADTTSPSVRVVRHPATYVDSVEPVRLTYAGRARDAVDGGRVTARLQVRLAQPGSQLGRWHAVATNSSGSFSVTARPGEERCLRILFFDRSGNERLTTPTCSVVPLDDRAVTRVGTAGRVRDVSYLGGGATKISGRRGAVRVGGLQGARVVVWMRTGPGLGQLVVRDADEVVQRIDTAAPRPGLRAVVLRPVGRRLQLEAADVRAVLVDATGLRRQYADLE